jgi:hypothetical protein
LFRRGPLYGRGAQADQAVRVMEPEAPQTQAGPAIPI